MESKVTVITGGSAGIGAALARELYQAGHSVVIAARRKDALESLVSELGERAIGVPTDVTRRSDVERLRDAAIAKFGRVDVWVNNAGRGISRPVLEPTDADFDEMMLVNVKSALYGIQAIVPYFIERDAGHLLNVSSFLGRVPVATRRSAYNAAKHALNALSANLRMDLREAHPNIHVALVMPGLVSTEFARNALGDTGAPPPPASIRMGVQTPEEVASVIHDVIENPVPEVYTNPASAQLTRSYYNDVAAFEAGKE